MKLYCKFFKVLFVGFAVCFILIFLTGCAHTIIASPKRPVNLTTETVPLNVGLYSTNEFKNYKISESRMGDTWNYINLGEASLTQFQVAFEQTFRIVKIIDEKPPFSTPKTIVLDMVIEPKIDSFYFDIPLLKFQIYPARIRYHILIYDLSGKVLLEKSIEGMGDTRGFASFSFSKWPSEAASKAIEDGVNKALTEVLNSEQIKTLIEKTN